MNAATIPVIIEQHAEEAAFLWILRSHAVHAPHYRLKDIAKLDNRVEAHLDGLRISGHEGWKLCEQALEIGESGEVFAAGLLALESKDRQKFDKLMVVAENSEEAVKGLISAFGWVEPSRLTGIVKYLLASNSSVHRRIGIAACAVHRANPGAILEDLLLNVEAPLPLRVRALRAVGDLKRRDLLYQLRDCFHAEEAPVCFWSAWSAVLLGDRGEALDILKEFVLGNPALSLRALPMLLRSMPVASSNAWLKELARYIERKRDLIAGTGMVGDSLYVPWLIKQMETPELARVAGESFSMITGSDIAYEDLDGNRPEGFESGPTENPQDENVAMDQDEDLPWPDPKKVQVWWEARKGRFQPGTRYLLGEPITEAQCQKVLRDGFQRQRNAAALELALMRPDAPLFEVRAPGWRQQRLLQNTG
jgi:uncharacterized protein (TIGR02270 family)